MLNFINHGHPVPRHACACHHSSQSYANRSDGFPIKRWLRSSLALLGLVAVLASGATAPVMAQGTPQAEKRPASLAPIVVSPPQRKPVRRTKSEPQRSPGAGRVAGRARTQFAVPAPVPASGGGGVVHSPLNTNVVAESASRLGLTVREIPATVEVIDQQTIREQGYRTVSEVAQGAVGVTSGDNPAEPSAFSMRGFTNSQISTTKSDGRDHEAENQVFEKIPDLARGGPNGSRSEEGSEERGLRPMLGVLGA